MSARAGLQHVRDFFKRHHAINFTRLQWVDYSGVLKTRIVPKSRSLQIAEGQNSYTLAQNCLIVPISTAPDCNPDGPESWHLQPDWSSLQPLAFAPLHCSVMCTLHRVKPREAPVRCPRSLLSNIIHDFQKTYQSDIKVGFEIEFVLLDAEYKIHKPVDRIKGSSLTAGLRGSTLSLIEEVVRTLEQASIDVYHFHTEIADQLEIALAPLPPLRAVDALLFTEEAIRCVAACHNLHASLAPRPVFNGPQNGIHMHLSLSHSLELESFLAGVLDKIKRLCAFGMPNFDSYVRVMDDGSGLYIGYGTENRDLPVRKIQENRWEFRFLDATANPYLFLAVVLSAGSDGVGQRKLLTWQDCTKLFDGSENVEDLAPYGIYERMPPTLRIALDAAKEDPDVSRWVGKDLLKQYVKVKEKELEKFGAMTDEERRQRYLTFF